MTVRKEESAKAATETLLFTPPHDVKLMQGPILTLTETEPDSPAAERAGNGSSRARINSGNTMTLIHLACPLISVLSSLAFYFEDGAWRPEKHSMKG